MVSVGSLRHPVKTLAGSSAFARSGHRLLQRGGSVSIAGGIIAAGIGTPLIASSEATAVASLLMLIVGLPHGALDIATIRRVAPRDQLAVVGLYLTAAAAMFAIWTASSVAALTIFYLIAIAHFSQDWEETNDRFFSVAIAVASLAAPALLHGPALRSLFVALTGDGRAASLVDVLMLVAPIAIATASVGLAAMSSAHRRAEGICTLAAMLVLPPVIGFAVFFCLFHSPRHLSEGWAAIGPKIGPDISARVAAMTLAGFGIAALIYLTVGRHAVPERLFVSSMVTLSVLTAPHMLLATILERWQSQCFGRPKHGRFAISRRNA